MPCVIKSLSPEGCKDRALAASSSLNQVSLMFARTSWDIFSFRVVISQCALTFKSLAGTLDVKLARLRVRERTLRSCRPVPIHTVPVCLHYGYRSLTPT